MNLVVIPFHDWRKINKEGFRTRDAHFIETFMENDKVNILIVNRPTTLIEIFLKKKKIKIEGDVIYKRGNFSLYKINNKTFLVDYISNDVVGQIIKKFKWFIDKYNDEDFISFINESLLRINFADYHVLSQNILSYKLVDRIRKGRLVFDGWDNFTKFRVYEKISKFIEEGYNRYSKYCDFWITNSSDNITFFKEQFRVSKIRLIKNGVDLNRFVFSKKTKTPSELKGLQKPIVGFGGKITHLLDVELINEVIDKTPNASFVFVGQVLDKKVYEGINKTKNFHYLGDIHYDEYPNYVKSFDVCIVPYVTDHQSQSGANSIKVYEYLATGKKVIGTEGNGLEDLGENLYLIQNADQFSTEIKEYQNNIKISLDLDKHNWKNKSIEILEMIEKYAD